MIDSTFSEGLLAVRIHQKNEHPRERWNEPRLRPGLQIKLKVINPKWKYGPGLSLQARPSFF